MIASGLKRLALSFIVLAGVTTAVSLLAAVATGTQAVRALSVGFMLGGAFVFCCGLAIGLRNPLRPTYRDDGSRSGVRVAGADEIAEGIGLSGVLVGLGIVLVIIGVAADPRTHLL
jgi:hypothetical protein